MKNEDKFKFYIIYILCCSFYKDGDKNKLVTICNNIFNKESLNEFKLILKDYLKEKNSNIYETINFDYKYDEYDYKYSIGYHFIYNDICNKYFKLLFKSIKYNNKRIFIECILHNADYISCNYPTMIILFKKMCKYLYIHKSLDILESFYNYELNITEKKDVLKEYYFRQSFLLINYLKKKKSKFYKTVEQNILNKTITTININNFDIHNTICIIRLYNKYNLNLSLTYDKTIEIINCSNYPNILSVEEWIYDKFSEIIINISIGNKDYIEKMLCKLNIKQLENISPLFTICSMLFNKQSILKIYIEICKKKDILYFTIIYNIYNNISNVILLSYFNDSHYKIVKILADNFGYNTAIPNRKCLRIKLFALIDKFIHDHVDDLITYSELAIMYKRTRNVIIESILNSNIFNTIIYENYCNYYKYSDKNLSKSDIKFP